MTYMAESDWQATVRELVAESKQLADLLREQRAIVEMLMSDHEELERLRARVTALRELEAERDALVAKVRELQAVEKAARHVLMTVSMTEYDERDFHLALEGLVKVLKPLDGGQDR